jgi:hypothetical protein
VIISGALAIPVSLFSSASMATHSWGNYHWERSSNPVAIPLGDNVDSNWDPHMWVASGDWNISTVLDTTIVPGSTRARQCKTSSGTVQVCNDTYGYKGWLGLASISVQGDHITAGYVKLNDSYHNNPPYDTYAWRQLVICQEIGHTFGLDHQDENFDNSNLGTCMDYTNDPDSNQHPNQHDYDELATIYSHLDSSGGGGGTDSGGGCNPRAPWCNGASAEDILSQIEMDGPAQWGRLVSEHGPQEVYELDFGAGRKVITFVTWTLEHAHDHGH